MTKTIPSEYISVNNKQIRYKQAGEGQPIVLIHGAGTGGLEDWEFSLFGKLAKTNHVIAFDRPGVGESALIDNITDPRNQAAALKQACNEIGVKMPVLVGHSYGGLVALAWATQGPKDVKGILAISAVSMPITEKFDLILRLLARPIIGPILARFVAKFIQEKAAKNAIKDAFNPSKAPDGYWEHIGKNHFTVPDTTHNSARELVSSPPYINEIVAKYPELCLPIEIIHGGADTRLPAETHTTGLKKLLPNAEITLVENIGHMAHYCAEPQIIAALARLTK